MTAEYQWLLRAVQQGQIPIVLADERAPDGGVPVFRMPIRKPDGTISNTMAHLFHEQPYLRACALIGLTVGAHQGWHAQTRNA